MHDMAWSELKMPRAWVQTDVCFAYSTCYFKVVVTSII